MRVVIAGCGRVGSDIALNLAETGHDVSIIDMNPDRFELLGGTFNGTTHEGLAYDVRTLVLAGIEFADVFVAVTTGDNANLMAVQVARKVFGVPRTIARLDDPARAEAYRALDITYVPVSRVASNLLVEQIVELEFSYHLTFSGGDVEVVEMVLGEEAEGLTVDGFEVPGGLRVAAVQRRSRTIVPDGDFALQEGDLVVAAARHGTRSKVARYVADGGSGP